LSLRNFSFPAIGIVAIALIFLLILFLPLMILGVVGRALSQYGLSWFWYLLFLIGSLAGSTVNLPIWKKKVQQLASSEKYVYFFGIPYPVQTRESRTMEAIISINLGGAILPLMLSAYLLLKNPAAALPSLFTLAIVAFLMFFVSKPVVGVGIVTPMFIPPIVAAITAIILGSNYAPVVAYAGGTLGTIIGADLFHLNSLEKMGAVNVSIGGAGTFDGIFLTGLFAVLLAY
jgi:uncharacterized membrane protein